MLKFHVDSFGFMAILESQNHCPTLALSPLEQRALDVQYSL